MKFSGSRSRKATSRKYINAAIAALAALAITAQANAADIYTPIPGGYKDVPPVFVPPPPVWTGFYAGINMGAAWTNLDLHRNSFNETGNPITCGGLQYCFGGDHINTTTAFGGGQLGYNWQSWGNFVFGVEVDLLGLGGNDERTYVGVGHSLAGGDRVLAATLRQNGGFAGDVTGRLGYAWGNWLLYAKGGWAWYNPELSASVVAFRGGNQVAGFTGWNNDSSLSGWTVGGGLEWLLNPNWSVKLEYMYYDYGLNNNNWDATYTANGVVHTYNSWRLFDNDLTANTVKLGVNYHLTNNVAVPLR